MATPPGPVSLKDSVDASRDYELTPSPREPEDEVAHTPDSPGYRPPSNIKSKRGRKRKKRDVDSEHSDNEDSGDVGFPASKLYEYQWPLFGSDKVWYMLQEQVAEYLDIRGMQRRYPDLERRTVDVEEKKYLIETEVVTETQGNMGLVALRSDEVLELMEEEFPTKYKVYLETIAERQTQLALDECLSDNIRLATSEVTREPSDREELMQKMVQEAAKYNKQCGIIRKRNQEQYLDGTVSTVPMVPRPTMRPQKKKRKGRYPVALVPGQYSDHVPRYTPEELSHLPLLTVTANPVKTSQ